MRALLAYLDAHSGTVAALATVAGVVVATAYSIFAALQWRATKTQADITRRIFESSQRPYVSLWLQEQDDGPVNAVTFGILLDNVGTVPANITRWQIGAQLLEADGTESRLDQAEEPRPVDPTGTSLFPNQAQEPLPVRFVHDGLGGTPLPLRLRVTVEYRGVSKRTYSTVLDVERTPGALRQRVHAT